MRRSRFLPLLTAVAVVLGLSAITNSATGVPRPKAAVTSAAARPAATNHTVGYDGYSFKVDGKRVYLWSGEFHYFRLPSPSLWLDIFEKMKAAGFNATSLYFDWGYHSPKEGVYDFTGVRDLDKLLDMAQRAGIYVIARPAPYINAEVDGGGFPGWEATTKGANRSADPDYLEHSDQWQTQVDRIIARHQYTRGDGPVIAYQVENEFYDGSTAGRRYMQHLEDKARADGIITVPLTGNNNGTFNSGLGRLDVDGPDSYPQGFDCSNPTKWSGVPDLSYDHPAGRPLYTPEFQGGAFDPWGGPGYDKCAQLINDRFANVFYKQNIAVGATAQSFYMTYGGTNWGWLGDPRNYTSYDYGAAIRENRQLDPKYYEDKLIGYFTQSVAPLTKTDVLTTTAPDNPAIVDTARMNPDTHTQFHVLRHDDSTSTSLDSTHISIDAPPGSPAGTPSYPVVPQQPGTAITLDGRDSHIVVADYRLGGSQLQYSTSEIMTSATTGGRDVAVLYGDQGSDGETVLNYRSRPEVTASGGDVRTTWDATTGDLRLDYSHDGLTRVRISGGGSRPMLLLLASTSVAKTFWRQDTAAGPVIVRGTHLLRTARSSGDTLALTGDNARNPRLEVFTAARSVTWNGQPVRQQMGSDGHLWGLIPTATKVTLPRLSGWKYHAESPEAARRFDDSRWVVADKTTTNSSTTPPPGPVLYADDYGFHTGNVWYRGHFRAGGGATGVHLESISGGDAQAFSVWLNGTFLGTSTKGSGNFTFPDGALTSGDNVLSVLTVNMGHNEDYDANNYSKEARGLTFAALRGSSGTPITWRLQGDRGGENIPDPVRGALSTGGLYGEREGWQLPGFPDGSWTNVSLPHRSARPGVAWYRTHVALHLPKDQDTSVGLVFRDAPAHDYRAMIFVNGWMLGNYVNYLGPQKSFPLPNGILNTHGRNTIALAVWNLDGSSGGPGTVSLTSYGSVTSSLKVEMTDSPGYSAAR